ncbi:cupin domain-containing protein [Aromatoleum anaerobium]|nr:cupin domain-containing protein [Aromatoleum anaerobium]MCK0507256.1 cupin domain-containing protein [Aromatoleum anaerobium]
MHIVVIPPGGVAQAHSHQDFETAIYVLEGRVETRYGPGLHRSVVSEAGDFLFIPPDVPHQAFNLSSTEPARAIVARNDADEQERVLPYDPAADG